MPEPERPSLRTFVRGRIVSGNGVAAVLYLALSLWVWLKPRQARAVWRRLQGQ